MIITGTCVMTYLIAGLVIALMVNMDRRDTPMNWLYDESNGLKLWVSLSIAVLWIPVVVVWIVRTIIKE